MHGICSFGISGRCQARIAKKEAAAKAKRDKEEMTAQAKAAKEEADPMQCMMLAVSTAQHSPNMFPRGVDRQRIRLPF
jgi:hypothetical protein